LVKFLARNSPPAWWPKLRSAVNEDSIIRKLKRQSQLIGDDCAIVPSPRNQDLLFTTDFSIEGVHFIRASPAEQVGYRAAARSLSDIAAMGGSPKYALVSVALAPWTDVRWIDGFYRGVNKILRQTGTRLAGGDLSHAKQLVVDVMLCGTVGKGKALRRDGAEAGDTIYVSGPLGGWRHKPVILPRLDIGRKLVGKAASCMDISDGLALDLHRLTLASGVAADIDSLPLLNGATIAQALHDGEDYELLYTAAPSRRVPGIKIGTIAKGQPGTVRYRGQKLSPLGYDHFQHRS
jgi:thiamine-monophosphate kinase